MVRWVPATPQGGQPTLGHNSQRALLSTHSLVHPALPSDGPSSVHGLGLSWHWDTLVLDVPRSPGTRHQLSSALVSSPGPGCPPCPMAAPQLCSQPETQSQWRCGAPVDGNMVPLDGSPPSSFDLPGLPHCHLLPPMTIGHPGWRHQPSPRWMLPSLETPKMANPSEEVGSEMARRSPRGLRKSPMSCCRTSWMGTKMDTSHPCRVLEEP